MARTVLEFYVIAASPMDVITQIQEDRLTFSPEEANKQLNSESWAVNAKIYKVEVKEDH